MNKKVAKNIGGLGVVGVGLALTYYIFRNKRQKRQKRVQSKVDKSQPKTVDTPKKYDCSVEVVEKTEDFLKKYREVEVTEEEKDYLKSIIYPIGNEVIRSALINNSFSGTLKCDTQLAELLRPKDDPFAYLGGIKGDKGIKGQARFFETGVKEFAPTLVFNILSQITLQHYLQTITENLNELEATSKQILERDMCDDIGCLRTVHKNMLELYNKRSYDENDLTEAKRHAEKAEDIMNKYMIILSEKKVDLNINSCMTNYEEIGKKIEKLEKSYFFNNFNILLCAESLYFMSYYILLKISKQMKRDEDIQRFAERIRTLNSREEYEPIFNRISHDILKYIELEAEEAVLKKKEINNLHKKYEDKFQQLKKKMDEIDSFIHQPFSLLLSIEADERWKVYVKTMS